MSSLQIGVRRTLDRVSASAMILAAASLFFMSIIQAWQVFARYVLNASPGWTEPVALVLMSFAVMFGAAVGVRRETQFAFLNLREALPGPMQGLLKSVSRLIAAAAGLGLTTMGGALMIDDWSVPMAGAPAPSGLRFAALAVGGLLILIFALDRLITGDLPPEPRED